MTYILSQFNKLFNKFLFGKLAYTNHQELIEGFYYFLKAASNPSLLAALVFLFG
jgi:hypothetical protein